MYIILPQLSYPCSRMEEVRLHSSMAAHSSAEPTTPGVTMPQNMGNYPTRASAPEMWRDGNDDYDCGVTPISTWSERNMCARTSGERVATAVGEEEERAGNARAGFSQTPLTAQLSQYKLRLKKTLWIAKRLMYLCSEKFRVR